ncbi:MAG: hypothetical protein M3R01_12950 [Actinomycetota bacterium]|nr:hypothetical protein [Actinomycetota bacterium]
MNWHRSLVPATALAVALAASATLPASAQTAPPAPAGDHQGPSYAESPVTADTPGAPTGSKPESKLWFHDGAWWSVMYHPASDGNRIFRLDIATQRWSATPTPVDDRNNARADVFWDRTHLYVASHVFDEYSDPPGNPVLSGTPSRLYRFSYNTTTDTWTRDAGFPVNMNGTASETLVMTKDSTGQLWSTWAQDYKVFVNRTTTGDTAWGNPFVLPVPEGSGLTADDISTIVSMPGAKVGVMWSNQTPDAFGNTTTWFSVHDDAAADETWGAAEAASTGPEESDDHISLKTDSTTGRVLAAVKTNRNGNDATLGRMLIRDAATGAWTNTTIFRGRDKLTRPVLIVDLRTQRTFVFASTTNAPYDVYRMSARLGTLDFGTAGRGRLVMHDDANATTALNNVTGSKRSVASTTHMVVQASDDVNDRYWHAWQPL